MTDVSGVVTILEKMGRIIQSIASINSTINPGSGTQVKGGAQLSPFEVPTRIMQ